MARAKWRHFIQWPPNVGVCQVWCTPYQTSWHSLEKLQVRMGLPAGFCPPNSRTWFCSVQLSTFSRCLSLQNGWHPQLLPSLVYVGIPFQWSMHWIVFVVTTHTADIVSFVTSLLPYFWSMPQCKNETSLDHLQPLTGEFLKYKTSNSAYDGCLGVSAVNFCIGQKQTKHIFWCQSI